MLSISEQDKPLVLAFLKREVQDFRWKDSSPEHMDRVTQEYMQALEDGLSTIDGKADFIVVQSITNMGLVMRELKLTPMQWGMEGCVMCALPPSPVNRGGGISVSRQGES